jgi:hypothetical protein
MTYTPISINEGTGTPTQADSIAGVKWAMVKLAFGPEGTATPITATSPLPIEGVLSFTGEDHIGSVGGHTIPVKPAITVQTTPDYSIGDVVGGEIPLINAVRVNDGTGVCQSIHLSDATNTKPELDIMIFGSNPAGTYTDNSAFPTASPDAALGYGEIHIAATDWRTFGSGAKVTKVAGFGVQAGGSARHLYMVIVTRTVINFALATDLRTVVTILAD